MKRNLLFSIMAIGFVAAYVGGATFAPFTDTHTATSDITSGTLIFTGAGSNTFSFSSSDFCSGANANTSGVAPGETCTGTFLITNTGSLAAVVGTPGALSYLITTDDEGCGASQWTATAVSTDVGTAPSTGTSATKFPPGDIQTVTVTLTLNLAADNLCQGVAATVAVTVDIAQASAANIHSTDDAP